MTYVAMLEDQNGDIVEIHHYCSPQCFTEGTGNPAYGNHWPCPEQTGYDQHCPLCGTLTVPALEDDDDGGGITPEGLALGHRYIMGNVNAYCPKCSDEQGVCVLDCDYDLDK